MKQNLRILDVAVYHPEEKVSNDFYFDHFDKQGKDIRRLLEVVGRKERYIADQNIDNTVSMAYKACMKLFKKNNLTGKDVDLIIFSSQCPEYLWPSQSLMLHRMLEANPDAQVFDINVNCVGMVVALDIATKMLNATERFNRALIVGSDVLSAAAKSTDEWSYPIFGDAACALILEKTDEENTGFINSISSSQGTHTEKVRFPEIGFIHSYNGDKTERQLLWQVTGQDNFMNEIAEMENNLLQSTNVKPEEIARVYYAQYAKSGIIYLSDLLGIPLDNFSYIGDKYGYTGTTSVFIALYEDIKAGRVKRGDLINIWSTGVGWTSCSILWRF